MLKQKMLKTKIDGISIDARKTIALYPQVATLDAQKPVRATFTA